MSSIQRAATALACVFAIATPSLALADQIKVPEGTEFPLRIEDSLSSKTAHDGDRFTVTLTDDVKLPDGMVLKAGYRGVGEVVHAEKSGMLGKTGKLDLRVSYLKVGEQRIRLRGSKGAEGKHNTGAQVVTVVLVGVFAAFIKGHNIDIPKGATFSAFVDQDLALDSPLAGPPPEA